MSIPLRTFARRRAVAVAAAVLTASTALLTGTAAHAAPPGALGGHLGSQDVYVSPLGDDHAPGTAVRPVRTLQRAQQLARTRDRNLTADLTVHLSPGTYRLTAPLALDASDSGSNGHRVVWQGSGGTVVSGGLQVTH